MGSTSSSTPTRRPLVSLAALALWGAACAGRLGPQTPAVPTPTVPEASPSRQARPGAVELQLFVRGELVWLDEDGRESQGKVPASAAPLGPPVETPSGILAEVGSSGDPFEIWLIRPGGNSELVAPSTQGLAFDPEGSRFAHAEVRSEGDAAYAFVTLVVTSLEELEPTASYESIEGYARVVGFAGDRVLVATGDGSTAGISLWDPGSNTLTPVAGYSGALATHPQAKLAVMTSGDGPCWSVVRLGNDGVTTPSGPTGCEGLQSAAFSPDGGALAAVAIDGEQRRVVAYAIDGTDPLFDRAIDGALQVAWASSSELLVLVELGSGSHAVHACPLGGDPCATLWSGPTGATGYGEVWLVTGG